MGKKIKKSKTVSSSVCRVHKSKNFTLLSNSFLRSSNLSLASVGLLGRGVATVVVEIEVDMIGILLDIAAGQFAVGELERVAGVILQGDASP